MHGSTLAWYYPKSPTPTLLNVFKQSLGSQEDFKTFIMHVISNQSLNNKLWNYYINIYIYLRAWTENVGLNINLNILQVN